MIINELKLYPFQRLGVDWLKLNRHALLADDMRLGKTPQSIVAANELMLTRLLVVCPASAVINWQRELKKWGNYGRCDVPVMSYERAVIRYNYLSKQRWDLLLIDESHMLKEPTAERTKSLLGNAGLIHSADRTWMLTGTPSPNHAGELWTTLFTFGATKLSYEGFISRYCNVFTVQGKNGSRHYQRQQISGTRTEHRQELRDLIAKVGLRRTKLQVFPEMPKPLHSTYYIEDSDGEWIFKMYPDFKEQLRKELEVLKEAIDFDIPTTDDKLLSTLQAMSQSVSSVRRYHGLKKVAQTVEIIKDELDNKAYDRVVIFGIHKDVLGLVKSGLSEYNPVMLVGGMTPKQKQFAQDEFQAGRAQVFIGNIQAAGTNITLNKGHQVIFIERDWVPGNNNQAADRCSGIGQTMPVTVRYIEIANSFDDKVSETLTRKSNEIATFIDQ